MTNNTTPISYADAGVNIETGNTFVENIKKSVQRTFTKGVVTEIGGFGGLFNLDTTGMEQPILVSGTDGVGTKLKLANMMNKHDTIGIDLVAMCVNDVLVCGAAPLFFLDYYATGELELAVAEQVVAGIADGCVQSNAALIGGETAEMPGMYAKGDYDLAGFCVGLVDKPKMLSNDSVKPGDKIVGISSSGPHSNGYSLIRKIIEVSNADLSSDLNGKPLGEQLLAPTQIYVKPVLALLEKFNIHAMAHITGGGITENLPRSMPENTEALINLGSWEQPAVFDWLQQHGNVEQHEMLKTFNCGIGMALIVDSTEAQNLVNELQQMELASWIIGEIQASENSKPSVTYNG